jgi:hypothetical protein
MPCSTACLATSNSGEPVEQLLLTLTTAMPLVPIRYNAVCPEVESPYT